MGESPEVLAKAHWAWLREILEQQLEVTGKLFQDAFIHGWKHGNETKGDKDG